MQRLLTAAVGGPLLLAATFLLPWPWFFALMLAAVALAAVELTRLLRSLAPGAAPLAALPALVVAAAVALALALAAAPEAADAATAEVWIVAGGLALTLGVSAAVLFGRTPAREALIAAGGLCFGTLYLALPAVALARLHQIDPWLPVLAFGVVWIGDSAAFYVGRRWGRHKMAPVVSPNKSWEGAAASLVAAIASAALWSWLVSREVAPAVVALGALANLAGQVGDLVESLFKRGSGIKDSGHLLPGHGGMLDRIDGLLFAAPVLWLAWVAFF
jgi:phosphatidate cytidylyltransferase